MGLSIAGELNAAERASYGWLAGTQLTMAVGGPVIETGNLIDTVERRETNYVAYVATGIWHHFLITGNADFLQRAFPMVQKAIELRAALSERRRRD